MSTDPAEGPIEAPLTVLADLQRQGLVRHIGLSNVTSNQIEQGRRICDIVCVQNLYNVAHREDDALIDELARAGIAYVPFFPLGGFTPLQSTALNEVATRLSATPMQVALAWLLQRAPNILLIPGTSSLEHLRENLAAASLKLAGRRADRAGRDRERRRASVTRFLPSPSGRRWREGVRKDARLPDGLWAPDEGSCKRPRRFARNPHPSPSPSLDKLGMRGGAAPLSAPNSPWRRRPRKRARAQW